MNILAINGSPRRRDSNTDRILQPFLRGAADAGAACETVYAAELEVKDCVGCFACWAQTPGVCVFNDDMVTLLAKIRRADILVWATPVYHFGMNVRLRRIVERTLPLNLPYMLKKGDRFRHPARYHDGPSQTALIANCGFPDPSNFDQSLFRYGPVLSTLAQGLIWAATLVTDQPLTLAYFKYNYPVGFETNPLFITINSKITAFWVGVFILQALIAIAVPEGVAARGLWMMGNYILLIPAFVFTARFPEWYIQNRSRPKIC
jgi:multimeric flavodoxin WrbA